MIIMGDARVRVKEKLESCDSPATASTAHTAVRDTTRAPNGSKAALRLSLSLSIYIYIHM